MTLQEIGQLVHANRSPAPALALPHSDLFDRIIATTAKIHRLALITRDANITDSGVVATLG